MNEVVDTALFQLRQLGAQLHEDPYDPIKGGLFDGAFELWVLALVTFLVLCLGSLAAGAGIGGGGLFVPLFAFVLGVGAKAAVPMSKATILGGAIGNMLSIAFARHPDSTKNRPLIDYESSTFMQSGELLGVIFGVLLNLLLPEIAIIVFLALLLSFNGYKTIQKGREKYRSETRRKSEEETKRKNSEELVPVDEAASSKVAVANQDPASNGIGLSGVELNVEKGNGSYTVYNFGGTGSEPEATRVEKGPKALEVLDLSTLKGFSLDDGATPSTVSPDQNSPPRSNSPPSSSPRNSKGEPPVAGPPSKPNGDSPDLGDQSLQLKLKQVIQEEGAQFPLWAWFLLTLMTAYTVAYALVKKSVISICDPVAYWVWYFTPVPVLCAFMYFTALLLKKRHRRRVQVGYVFVGADEKDPVYRDMQWTDHQLKRFPSIALLAGVAAGLLGIGGGMVIGPLFIQLDMQPKVGSSSCAFMILWTAISGVIQYAFAGKIGWQFILYGVVVGFVSGQCGQRFVDAALKKSGRPSYVIFLLGGIVCVACASMTGTGIYKLIKGVMAGDNMFEFDLYDFQCHE